MDLLKYNSFYTEVSKKNLDDILFIKNHNSDLIDLFFKEINYNKLITSESMKKTYEYFKECYIQQPNIIKNKQTKLEHNKYLDYLDIIDGIKNKNSDIYKEYINLNTHHIILLKIREIEIEINLFYKDKTDLLDLIIKRINTIIYYCLDNIRTKYLSKNLFKVFLVLIPVNRYIENEKYTMDQLINKYKNGTYNCTSGYTYLNSNSKNIIIVCSKIPEILSLIIHEFCHVLGLDSSLLLKNNFYLHHLQENQLKTLSKKICLINDNYNFWEIIAQTNTTIIHSIILSLELMGDYKLFSKILKIEILYSLYHTAKILYISGYMFYEDFFEDNCQIFFKQKSKLFEYTIARSFMFLIYSQIFLEEYITTNKNTFKLEYPDKIYEKVDDDIIKKINKLNNKIIQVDTTNKYKEVLNKFFEYIRKTQPTKFSMEYTCLDIIGNNDVSKIKTGGYKYKYNKYKKKYLKLRSDLLQDNILHQ